MVFELLHLLCLHNFRLYATHQQFASSLIAQFRYLMLRKAIVITGPTASGKSEFAFNLASHLGGEIVMCDTLQVCRRLSKMYKNFPVAANHPPKNYTDKIRYHNLAEIDCLGPKLNAYEYNSSKLGWEKGL